MTTKIVTLTTDFGLKDSYVAEMKAVILSICSDAVIVDISHEVEKFNIRMGAYVLASAATYFPRGTVHVAVIDPGVGTQRRALLIQTKLGFFIGPDNGVLVLAAEKQPTKNSDARRFPTRSMAETFLRQPPHIYRKECRLPRRDPKLVRSKSQSLPKSSVQRAL